MLFNHYHAIIFSRNMFYIEDNLPFIQLPYQLDAFENYQHLMNNFFNCLRYFYLQKFLKRLFYKKLCYYQCLYFCPPLSRKRVDIKSHSSVRPSGCLSVCPSVCHKNLNHFHNFWTSKWHLEERALNKLSFLLLNPQLTSLDCNNFAISQ